ncbi:MAG: hypothetical protein ACJLS3_15300 [Erythrobacter sp.]
MKETIKLYAALTMPTAAYATATPHFSRKRAKLASAKLMVTSLATCLSLSPALAETTTNVLYAACFKAEPFSSVHYHTETYTLDTPTIRIMDQFIMSPEYFDYKKLITKQFLDYLKNKNLNDVNVQCMVLENREKVVSWESQYRTDNVNMLGYKTAFVSDWKPQVSPVSKPPQEP